MEIEGAAAVTNKITTQALLTFSVGGQYYGLPVANVIQIIEMVSITHIPHAPRAIQGIINVRGKVTPVIDMRLRFGLAFEAYQLYTPIILTTLNNQMFALVVDNVEQVVEIPLAEIERQNEINLPTQFSHHPPANTAYLSGVAKTDKQLILILNPETILTPYEKEQLMKVALENPIKGMSS